MEALYPGLPPEEKEIQYKKMQNEKLLAKETPRKKIQNAIYVRRSKTQFFDVY